MRLTPYSLLVLLVVVLASCSTKVKVPVPADTSIVVHIDGKSLLSKYSWEDFKKSDTYTTMLSKKQDSLTKKILENPDNSGINIGDDFFCFIKERGEGAYWVFTGLLKDDDAFAAVMKKSFEKQDVVKEGKLKVITVDAGDYLTWTGSRFVLIGNMARNNYPGKSRFNDLSGLRRQHFGKDSLLKFANEIYDIKESATINTDKRFAELLQQPGELHAWINSDGLFDDILTAIPFNLDPVIKGNVRAITVSFDNGKITGDSKTYYNEKLAGFYAKNPPKNISEDMLKKLPGNDITAVFATNYPVPVLKDILGLTGVDGFANQALGIRGFTLDDVLKSVKGDIFVAISADTTTVGGEMNFGHQAKPGIKVIAGVSLNDQSTFDTLLAVASAKMEEFDVPYAKMKEMVPHYVKDGWFFIGNDSAALNSYGKTNTDHAFIRRLAGHPMAGYINLQKSIGNFSPGGIQTMRNFMLTESNKTWEDIIFYGNGVKDGVATGHFEINFVDKNTNSLKQMNDYLGRMSKGIKELEPQIREEMMREWQQRMDSAYKPGKSMDDVKLDIKKLNLKDVKLGDNNK